MILQQTQKDSCWSDRSEDNSYASYTPIRPPILKESPSQSHKLSQERPSLGRVSSQDSLGTDQSLIEFNYELRYCELICSTYKYLQVQSAYGEEGSTSAPGSYPAVTLTALKNFFKEDLGILKTSESEEMLEQIVA